jgi:Ca2+-binding RTX toxin-like protein
MTAPNRATERPHRTTTRRGGQRHIGISLAAATSVLNRPGFGGSDGCRRLSPACSPAAFSPAALSFDRSGMCRRSRRAREPATIVGEGVIVGTAGPDVIVGSDEDDTILGLGGDDVICGEGGNDRVLGGDGDDVLIGDAVDLPPFIPSNGENDDTLIGGAGNDTLAGLGGDDALLGGSGDDMVIGMGGNDRIDAGSGNDTVFGGPLDDDISGGPGDDTLWGNYGSDDISGGPGTDFIDGDNPFPPPPEGLPFPPGGNDDRCVGGPATDTINNCETTIP